MPPSVMTNTAARSIRLRRPIRRLAAAIFARTDWVVLVHGLSAGVAGGTYGRRPRDDDRYFRSFASSAWACAAESGM